MERPSHHHSALMLLIYIVNRVIHSCKTNPETSRHLDRPFEVWESLNIIRHCLGIMSNYRCLTCWNWVVQAREASVNSKPVDPLLGLVEHPLQIEGRPSPWRESGKGSLLIVRADTFLKIITVENVGMKFWGLLFCHLTTEHPHPPCPVPPSLCPQFHSLILILIHLKWLRVFSVLRSTYTSFFTQDFQ